MKKNQSNRLTEQHKHSQGVIGIFGDEAQKHDAEVFSVSHIAMKRFKEEHPTLTVENL